jgi:hypothetical protein
MEEKEKQKEKLINDYRKVAGEYSKENDKLEQKINDLKISLKLNQELLYDCIKKSARKNDDVDTLINKTKTIWEKTQSFIEGKILFEIKIARLQEMTEDTPTKIREQIKTIDESNTKKQEEITEKDKIIKKLKNDLIKTRQNALFKCARNEVYVTEPTKTNLDSCQELLNLKSILSTITPINHQKVEDAEKLQKDVDELKKHLNKLFKKAMKLHMKMIHKKSIINDEYNKEDENSLIKSIEGYDPNIDKEEEEEEEDDCENNIINDKENSDSEEEEHNKNKKRLKAKEKELEKLNEVFIKLKNESLEYEKKINEHKKIYKEIKAKIKNLKKSTE